MFFEPKKWRFREKFLVVRDLFCWKHWTQPRRCWLANGTQSCEEGWAKAITSKNPAINIGAKEMLSGLAIQISGGGETGLNDLDQVSILQILPKCAPCTNDRGAERFVGLFMVFWAWLGWHPAFKGDLQTNYFISLGSQKPTFLNKIGAVHKVQSGRKSFFFFRYTKTFQTSGYTAKSFNNSGINFLSKMSNHLAGWDIS